MKTISNLFMVAFLLMCSVSLHAQTVNDLEAAYNRKDYHGAFTGLLEYAERGDPRAQYLVGLMYWNSRGVSQNDSSAVNWYRKAAEQGSADAQHELGLAYALGRGSRRTM